MSSNHFSIKRFRKSEIIIDQSLYVYASYCRYISNHGEADYPDKETKVRRILKWSPNLEREYSVLRTPCRKVGKPTEKGK